jgi:hypothetical protein
MSNLHSSLEILYKGSPIAQMMMKVIFKIIHSPWLNGELSPLN